MMKDKLKPHVYKVKGRSRYAFYDLLKGIIYRISSGGSIENTRDYLLKNDLIFETTEPVPFKMELDLSPKMGNIQLRELQIKLSGKPEDTCWNRNPTDDNTSIMADSLIDCLELKTRYLPIRKIKIDTHAIDMQKITKIAERFNYETLELISMEPLTEIQAETLKKICTAGNQHVVFTTNRKSAVTEYDFDINSFFYSQKFNPCLGQQVAIDCGGEIKPCLWSADILGNIETGNLKDMIIEGHFDGYWEMSKDKIDDCKECEKRYACNDCRVSAEKEKGTFLAKPAFCDYIP